MDFANFLIQLLNSVQYGLLLFLLAAGLTLIFGIMGVINLAHGSFYMLGAYLAWSLAEHDRQLHGRDRRSARCCRCCSACCSSALLFRHFYERDHLEQVLLTFGLILVFEELRCILVGRRRARRARARAAVRIDPARRTPCPIRCTGCSCRACASRSRSACTC